MREQGDQLRDLGENPIVGKRVIDGAVVISVTGEIDMATAPYVEEAMAEVIAEITESARAGDSVRLIVDLTDVRFLGSAGLAVLASASTRLREHGGTASVVVNHQHGVLRALEITGLTELLPVFATVDEALAG